MKAISVLVVLLVAINTGSQCQSNPAQNDKAKAATARLVLGGLPVGTKAPELKVEEWLSEKPDLKGKFVALDFWGTNCGPCISGFAHLNELHRKYKDKVAFIASTLNDSPDVYVFEKASIEFYSGLWKSWDAYNIQGIPHMIIVDPKGIVRFSGNGHDVTDEVLQDLFVKYGS